ncbi:arrestin domain-containing protein 3-like [Thalassophryne amazonica]|uniref:arrestin domain-containing protein 3-like n=1 Tax=Thalassophryne amazonica TaxID=390379 RepID=UPI0014722858|nr:arrestin domain-containing protein 3-like [Thalassophryne amazonica]
MMTVKRLSVDCDKLNERGTFSPGDTLSGTVTVVTTKQIKVQRFVVKAKGKAQVTWTEKDGQATLICSDKKKYFYFENIILQDKKGDGSEVIGPGKNVYSFVFQIPSRDMPSSYEGKWGKITYSVQAKLTQSIWVEHKIKTEVPFLSKAEFPFVSKTEMIIIGLKEPQYGTRISFYGTGTVTMNVSSEKIGLKQGEAMGVSVEVLNNSPYTVMPTFYLHEKQTFAAQSKRRLHVNDILLATGEPVSVATSQKISKVLSFPSWLQPTFYNCSLMKLEYSLKVTLDAPLGKQPEVKLPLIILLGSPKPSQQKAKRSIWFRKFPGYMS